MSVVAAFPGAAVHVGHRREAPGIVDSWPEDVDDGAARRDWGFAPVYDFTSARSTIPDSDVRERYR